MSVRLVVRSVAERDLLAAFQYYESISPRLGAAFMARVDDTLAAIRRSPAGYRKRFDEFRLLTVRRFPYGVFFVFDGTTVVVVAILNLLQDPRSLRESLAR